MQLDQPQGLQLDHSGNILVVESGRALVDIFPPGSTSPSQVAQAQAGVTQVVLREAGDNMYVSNFATGDVYISHYPPAQFQVKTDSSSSVQGMALSNEER
jgi:DNA-binding beta-propeller fold protein YncE